MIPNIKIIMQLAFLSFTWKDNWQNNFIGSLCCVIYFGACLPIWYSMTMHPHWALSQKSSNFWHPDLQTQFNGSCFLRNQRYMIFHFNFSTLSFCVRMPYFICSYTCFSCLFKVAAKVNFHHSAHNDSMVLNVLVISWCNMLTETNKIKIETKPVKSRWMLNLCILSKSVFLTLIFHTCYVIMK